MKSASSIAQYQVAAGGPRRPVGRPRKVQPPAPAPVEIGCQPLYIPTQGYADGVTPLSPCGQAARFLIVHYGLGAQVYVDADGERIAFPQRVLTTHEQVAAVCWHHLSTIVTLESRARREIEAHGETVVMGGVIRIVALATRPYEAPRRRVTTDMRSLHEATSYGPRIEVIK